MKSLQDLNNHSKTSLDVTDSRGSKVVFNRVSPLQPLDIVSTISSTTISVSPGGNEIIDIINYSTAATRFRVRITTGGSPLLTGSTLSFGTLPSGLTLTTASGVYTISGIKTVADWNSIKNFVWSLPATYYNNPLWYLDVAIVYYDSILGEDVTVDWEVYDPRFYYIAKLTSQFTQYSNVGILKKTTASMSSSASLDCPGSRVYRFTSAMSATATMAASVDVTQRISPMPVVATLNILATEYNKFTYRGNAATQIILPAIEDFAIDSPIYSYVLVIDPAQGELGTSTTSGSSITLEGTRTSINSQLSNIYYYPTFGRTADSNFTFTYAKNGVTMFTKVFTMYYYALSGQPTNYYSYTSSGTWIPTLAEQKYSVIDLLLVGGGGAGVAADTPLTVAGVNQPYGESGGGAGQIVQITGITPTSGLYNIVVGSGGATSTSNGGTTSVVGVTATTYDAIGGYGASVTTRYNTIPQYTLGYGGNNGGGTKMGGRAYSNYGQPTNRSSSYTGGGGAGSNTDTPTYPNPPYNGNGQGGASVGATGAWGGAGGFPLNLTWNPSEGVLSLGGGGRGNGPDGPVSGTRYTGPGSGGQGGRWGFTTYDIKGFAGIVKIRTRAR
jgi:hypothetical protein